MDESVALYVRNHENNQNLIIENLSKIFEQHEIFNTEIQITNSHPNFEEENFLKPSKKTDCMHGRTLSATGIYACPFLSNDYRGRVGSNFKNYATNFYKYYSNDFKLYF